MSAQPQLSVVEGGADRPSVVELLSRVMEDVQSVRKGDRNAQQGFNFRGIDSVVNAVGPALRKHGVVAVPVAVSSQFEHYESSKGTPMRNTVLTITWRFHGPAGDSIDAQTMGEASDSGDKSVPKAHSVAYRTLLLQALCIPTDEADPDSDTHERGNRAQPETEWVAFESSEKWLRMIEASGTMTELDGVVAQSKPFTFSDADKALLGAAVAARKAELSGDTP